MGSQSARHPPCEGDTGDSPSAPQHQALGPHAADGLTLKTQENLSDPGPFC